MRQSLEATVHFRQALGGTLPVLGIGREPVAHRHSSQFDPTVLHQSLEREYAVRKSVEGKRIADEYAQQEETVIFEVTTTNGFENHTARDNHRFPIGRHFKRARHPHASGITVSPNQEPLISEPTTMKRSQESSPNRIGWRKEILRPGVLKLTPLFEDSSQIAF